MEKISALMDSELSGQDARQALLRLGDTPEARDAWATYHLIGDVMRGQSSAVDVASRVAVSLQSEPTVLAPRQSARSGKALTFALSAAASVSAIAVVGWMAFSTGSLIHPAADLAQSQQPAPALASVEPPLSSSPIDGQMNEYLLAHQGVSPSSGLQGVAPYIRSISTAPATDR